ncbi:efflux RND transporter periplasmic adaptor subunit [Rhodopirellula sp. MGV]|uniref:efflux RND transporter periplasmic adaptor subunit n=1 Tax=Rhodopirellula sp. MGV TaxID=2023130 RepID=UPI000B96B79B|nr:efflux RND transporter periplasmic adaptor subunit [Rhodopirellula sp. MGV]OYP31161.1 hypothetical protein CGZ80_21470 [Rhodopirellula sp. MGV]PNY36016.1 hypothetical protein C2E31_14950 [Rhodopirellula baltica]
MNRDKSGQPAVLASDVVAPLPVTSPTRQERTSSESESMIDARSLAIVEQMAAASDRTAAITLLVKFVSEQYPGCLVRCGIGGATIRRLLDSKLGWLGPASELFQQASERWDEDAKLIRTPTSAEVAFDGDQLTGSSLSGEDRSVRMNIDDEMGLGRCVLWIEGNRVIERDRVWLRRALPSIRSLLWHQSGGWLTQTVRQLSGYGYVARLYIGLAVVSFIVLASWPVSYRVRCATVVRPLHSRVISAPFESTLQSANVQIGDAVEAGDVLITLDGRPLRLELDSIEAQLAQAEKERDIAMATGKVAEGQQAALHHRELSRKHELLSNRLRRLQVISPISGIVVSGDLERSIGMSMQMGHPVLEIAPLDQMLIELEIPEAEVGFVEPKTPARIRLSGLQDTVIDQPVKAIHPSAEIRDEQNVFVATIEVSNADELLRPGMRGEAIAYGPIRPWLWSHIRGGVEKVLWWIGI